MKIKKVILEHIRSYIREEINFPDGSVLLSGNIGSGKSTILLAIEFALFGVMRSGLTGASLLRNGEDKGSVTLFLEIEGKPIEIYRALKKTATSVAQDAGYLIVDGIKKDGTAIELKQAVLELLHYPQDMLTKSKSLIYRYTVYTPQEEMKQILLGNAEDRLETLRRVFGIDKYQKVAHNAKIVVSRLKEKKKELSGRIYDLNEKISLKLLKDEEIVKMKLSLESLRIPLEESEKEVLTAQNNIKEIEVSLERSKQVKKEMGLLDLDLRHKIGRMGVLGIEIETLTKEILVLQHEKLEVDDQLLKKQLEEKKSVLEGIGYKKQEARDQVQALKTKIFLSEMLKKKVEELNNCPTCYQEVSLIHKENVIKKESLTIDTCQKEISGLILHLEEHEKGLGIYSKEIEALQKQLHSLDVIKLKLISLQQKKEKLVSLQTEEVSLKKEIGAINLKRTEYFTQLESLQTVEETFIFAKEQLEKALSQKQVFALKNVEFATKLTGLQEVMERLSQEIEVKLKEKQKLVYSEQVLTWLDTYFINLMLTMEKNIMLKVHADFNALFENWFSLLVDSTVMHVKLDDTFSPEIEQNGYPISYQFLSGGEKTAAALAYRLALNQVINTLMTTITTKDLIILDEPTDGFSSEQLDRLRILLEDIDVSQLLIVSHEQKIESFVDTVIKLQKVDHVSRVL